MAKELLFSVTHHDCIMQTFRCASAGGQNGNKVNSGVRFIHQPSGAVGEGREFRDQLQNKKAAFRRMIKTKEFENWHKVEISRRMGKVIKTIDEIVDKMMAPENLKIEYNI